jgi:hypothetical protein
VGISALVVAGQGDPVGMVGAGSASGPPSRNRLTKTAPSRHHRAHPSRMRTAPRRGRKHDGRSPKAPTRNAALAKSVTFMCVFRAGKKYNAEHVARLQAAVARNCTVPHRFVALSDVDMPCERIPFAHDWPRWWSKIELFRPGITDPTGLNVYLDLDVLVASNLDALVSYPHRFSMMRNSCTPILPTRGGGARSKRANSSVMAWSGDYSFIYDKMVAHPRRCQFLLSAGVRRLDRLVRRAGAHRAFASLTGDSRGHKQYLFPGCSLVVNLMPRAEQKTVKEADVKRVLFVSFEGPGAKARLRRPETTSSSSATGRGSAYPGAAGGGASLVVATFSGLPRHMNELPRSPDTHSTGRSMSRANQASGIRGVKANRPARVKAYSSPYHAAM